jgi:hypothetical protein
MADRPARRRAQAHRKIADVLEQLHGSALESRAAELAHHFLAATKSADAAKAVSYCNMAGDQALAQVAPADAVGWFAQALDLYPQLPAEEGLHCDLLVGLGMDQIRSGDPAVSANTVRSCNELSRIGSAGTEQVQGFPAHRSVSGAHQLTPDIA